MKCNDCGTKLEIGMWPFCPDHGYPVGHHPFVAYWDDHIVPGGAYVTSHYQRKKLLKSNNSDFKGRRIGMPGCEV